MNKDFERKRQVIRGKTISDMSLLFAQFGKSQLTDEREKEIDIIPPPKSPFEELDDFDVKKFKNKLDNVITKDDGEANIKLASFTMTRDQYVKLFSHNNIKDANIIRHKML
jgi:hypothetical protein